MAPETNACTGLGAFVASKGRVDHCCYWDGVRCPHLVDNQGGRRYACGLLLQYGSWAAMTASPEYLPVGTWWADHRLPFNYCETFDPAFCCRPELRLGRANEHSPVVVA